jgi:adenine-specific DNA-methyltransferase
MTDRVDCRSDIATALSRFSGDSLPSAASGLLAAMGYRSDRTLAIATAQEFIAQLDPERRLTEREQETLKQSSAIHLLFQITDEELAAHGDMFRNPTELRPGDFNSYLFFAVDLPARPRSRTELSALVRAINKPLAMPALVFFRHGASVSLGVIHRRLSKRDVARNVLEKVTLVKDIDISNSIRAHLEILNDFAFANLAADFEVRNFASLHEAWQKRLDAEALSRNFYREVADWYFWAHHLVKGRKIELPRDCDTEQEQSLFLIRLLTRIIFCWFLVEKRLVPPELFQPHRLRTLLKDFSPSTEPRKPDLESSYYQAVLQNLFFGTLNMPREQRAFREKKAVGERFDGNYGITNLWRHQAAFRNSAAWEALAARVPFLNGGLFDCLDDKLGRGHQSTILDGFSDNPKLGCQLPNDLFFGPERTVDLSKDYGENDKQSARSKKARVRGLIEILSRYKFTIEENTPLEQEIALDPELLGKVFENLLASYNEDTRSTARKALGAFYTPREIVSYMVDEALKAYLTDKVPRCKGALDDLFSNKATLRGVAEETRIALVRAIGDVKLLDPACGSGAFPMGALHRLVDLLAKLDPNNESWKRDRLEVARLDLEWLKREKAGEDRIADAEARIGDIDKSFDTRFHALDYARKLYLIENAIYGVDVQPVAVQIAKLRFFISLMVDQNVDPVADNLGVRPLPNLETRLVAADSLIPIEKEESNLFSGEIEKLRRELADIRHEHFNARSPAAKRRWRAADQAKRQEISRHLEQNHMLSKSSAKALAAWDPYDQNSSAPFFDSEWMFGLPVGRTKREGRALVTMLGSLALVNEAGGQRELTETKQPEFDSGFDVVIGNPPYVRPHKIPSDYKEKLWAVSDVFEKKADLYSCFLERGLLLLRPSGQLSFIVSNGFLRLDSFEKLRRFLLKNALINVLIDFADNVFQSAAVKTCIVLLSRDADHTNNQLVRSAVLESVDQLARATFKQIRQENFAKKYKSIFDLSIDPLVESVKELMEKGSKRLGEAFDIQFGLKTGDDKKFLSRNAPTKTHKRLLRGENVGRYWLKFAGEYVWYVPDKMTAHRSTARPGTKERFEQPKILVRDTGDGLMAMYDDDDFFVKDVLVVTDGSKDKDRLKTLLALLNSTSLRFYYETSFPTLHVQRDELASLPLPAGGVLSGSPAVNAVVDLVLFLVTHDDFDILSKSSRDGIMLAFFERLLDCLVYELYFPAEAAKATINLKGLIEKAGLPKRQSLSGPHGLRQLRRAFETCFDETHLLRVEVEKVKRLPMATLIESKISRPSRRGV